MLKTALLFFFASGGCGILPLANGFSLSTRTAGRAPLVPDKIQQPTGQPKNWQAQPVQTNSQAKLIVLQITDVYTLEHFASFKTLLEDTKKKAQGAKVICMLTGDFLSPYLLSSVDKGAGMMKALQNIPMDYLTWGNHEADIDHPTVCQHVRNFNGKWINSNMINHEAMDCQQEFDVVEITSPDGTNTRKVGLCAVLSDDEALYSHFKQPGAFGGAKITDPWQALKKYKTILEEEEGCDMVLPLQHLYVPDDHKTCQDFDFPVILSGHDHHRVDEVVDDTRLIKPGMNAEYSTVLEISWDDQSAAKPTIQSRFVKCSDWQPDAHTKAVNEKAYDVLQPMQNTELARVPPVFEPLSSMGARQSVCTMGQFICTLLKTAMNSLDGRPSLYDIDAVLLMGGNIRGNKDYEHGDFFSLEALEAEIKSDEVVGVVPMPGWLLAEGIQATHAGEPISGWFQFDDGVSEDTSVSPPVITHVGGKPLDPDRFYRVATKISDLTNGQSPPMTEYYTENAHLLPKQGNYVNIQSKLMGYFAENLWNKLWDAMEHEIPEECGIDSCGAEERMEILDAAGDGEVSVEDIQRSLNDLLGYSVDDRDMTLAENVHKLADFSGNGKVTLEDIEMYCDIMQKELQENEAFRLPEPELTSTI